MTFSRIIGILVLALALLPAQARAHLKLQSSSPAQGDTVRQPVSQLTLTFSEAIDEAWTEDRYRSLVLVAPKRSLGELRGLMSKRVQKSIAHEVPKDLTASTRAAVWKALSSTLPAPI
jgi:protein required for attachment to host cells